MMGAEEKVRKLSEKADIRINGNRPWDIQVHNNDFYSRILSQGTLGLGESYMDGWWDCERVDEMISKAIKADLADEIKFNPVVIFAAVKAAIFNLADKTKAWVLGEHHYDVGNDLYKKMLDERMIYTCGWWKDADNLEEAQENKLDLICRKLNLKEGMSVLDIGCGWGGFLKYAVKNYGVSGVGLTISKEQAKLARKMCEGLPIEIKLKDYREEDNEYDRVVSIGMFEHVGWKNHKKYMKAVERCLKPESLSMLHTIGRNESTIMLEPWTKKYIFPTGTIPSIKQIGKSMEGLLMMEDWHNFGPDYDKTLMSWYRNFNDSWDSLEGYDERFRRMWNYYLQSCAGAFRARRLQLWQIVLSNGVDGYRSIR
ncbi:MAG: cyclopropane fatty acyl phospholipid synthase [Candidatus Magasanikbacteria bacterium]